MAVQRWIVLDADGVVQNVVLWDADANSDWSPPEGCTVVPDDGTTPTTAPADPPPTEATLKEKIAAVIEAISALVDDRPHDAVAALATVTDEGTTP